MIPNTATSLLFSVSSTFTITSPRSIDAIRAESSPMRCWRNVASLAGGCCACSGTPTVAPQPASATQPSSLIPRVPRPSFRPYLGVHHRAEVERSHEQRDTSHDRKGGDQSHDRGERDRRSEQREPRRGDAEHAERRRPAPLHAEPLLQNRPIDSEDAGEHQPPGDQDDREAQREPRVVHERGKPEPDAYKT